MDAQPRPIDGPKPERLYEELLRRILSDELPAGSLLPPERELAAELGTNRNTLREAIRRLEQARLVAARRGSGVRVLDFRRTASMEVLGPFLAYGRSAPEKARTVLDVLEPRVEVQVFALRMACAGRATLEDLERLDDAIALAREAERERDGLALARAQITWLEALVEASHNVPMRWVANPLLAAMRELLERNSALMLFEPSFAAYARGARSAVAHGDAERAIKLTRDFHGAVDAQLRRLLEPLAALPEDPR